MIREREEWESTTAPLALKLKQTNRDLQSDRSNAVSTISDTTHADDNPEKKVSPEQTV